MSRDAWRPRGVLAWLLTGIALLVLVISAALAYWMIVPVRWNGPGEQGAAALMFPLHLLAGTAAAAVLALVARRARARVAAWAFGLGAILTASMALTPEFLLWRHARMLGAPLSLGEYITNGGHLNLGQPRPDLTVTYGTANDGAKLELDAWRTGLGEAGPPRPAMVMIHGGAWNLGNRSMLPEWNRWLNELGYEVFDVEYRMPPPVRWLDEVGDVKAAAGWVAAHAAEYHVDPSRISVMGGSAGAHLAMLAAYSASGPAFAASTDAPPVMFRTVINVYGPTDLALLYRTTHSPDFWRPLMWAYTGGMPGEFPARYSALSPLRHITPNAPPTITLLGTSDRLVSVDHARLLDEALSRAGVPHEMYLLPATDHGFDINWGGFATQIARDRLRHFLGKHDGG